MRLTTKLLLAIFYISMIGVAVVCLVMDIPPARPLGMTCGFTIGTALLNIGRLAFKK